MALQTAHYEKTLNNMLNWTQHRAVLLLSPKQPCRERTFCLTTGTVKELSARTTYILGNQVCSLLSPDLIFISQWQKAVVQKSTNSTILLKVFQKSNENLSTPYMAPFSTCMSLFKLHLKSSSINTLKFTSTFMHKLVQAMHKHKSDKGKLFYPQHPKQHVLVLQKFSIYQVHGTSPLLSDLGRQLCFLLYNIICHKL